ncbi:unnamed protein product [Kluyveromyces dobzhanskii CBS 2104]|uniref:WGS project CCBQ000000000 data, contig 00104 n=1 Tax=Kluyveromyces dobzhanskii CBS 2104 TaxID=1427455 RepID=A0A0A8L5U7_9SACH|nr:unnamed protein product [Kluyveromyces dobzhanskii CBS 2104]
MAPVATVGLNNTLDGVAHALKNTKISTSADASCTDTGLEKVQGLKKILQEEEFYDKEVYPPIVHEPVADDLPLEKIYGANVTAAPELIADETQIGPLVQEWLDHFNVMLNKINTSASSVTREDWSRLFSEHGAWRDHLAVTFDLHSFIGLEKLSTSLQPLLSKAKLSNFELDKLADYRYNSGYGKVLMHEPKLGRPPVEWVQVYYSFENKLGSGKGIARLAAVYDETLQKSTLKAFSFYTALEDFKDYPEAVFGNRPEGVSHGQHVGRESWVEKREKESTFDETHQPSVLIVGGGQGGLTTAARLKMFGINSLIIEMNPKIGDNWRNRYKFLVLHDPVWYDHLPYLNFPPSWPIFTPKDKIGDWFEGYAKTMDLNYRCSSMVTGASFDDAEKKWTVEVKDFNTGEIITYTPDHMIMATGHSGEPRMPKFQDQELFKGKIVHSSKHGSGAEFAGGKALVVGGCNSAHDICQDFYEQKVDVTMLQRSSTCIITVEHGMHHNIRGVYDETGPTTETADRIFHSMPLSLLNAVMQQQYRASCDDDIELLKSLEARGFKTNAGYGGTGLFGLYFRQGSGYYIDVGCSKLICDGKVKIKQGQSIERFLPSGTGVELTDGTILEGLDVIVMATGYTNMKETARRLFGDKVADRLDPVWGLDKEGELKTIWRDSGHPNFWYMGGNLAVSRYYSKRLALRIIQQLKGLEY